MERVSKAGGALLVLILMLGACNRSQPVAANGAAPAGNQTAAAAPPAAAPGAKKADAEAVGEEEEETEAVPQEAHEDRSGPTRRARCNINDEGLEPCSFTPVMGDGSFDVDTADREIRLLISDGEGAVYERVGSRNIPLPGAFRRDEEDTACWSTDDPDATVRRVCAY